MKLNFLRVYSTEIWYDLYHWHLLFIPNLFCRYVLMENVIYFMLCVEFNLISNCNDNGGMDRKETV